MPSGTPITPAFAGLSPRGGVKDHSSSGSPPQTPSPTRTSTYTLGARVMGGGLNFAELARWEEIEVTAWLQSLRLGNHSATFARNDITGAVLLDVDQNALKEMGISSVGDRIRISTAIKNIKKKCIEADAVIRTQIQLQSGDMEYLDNDSSRSLSGAPLARRSISSRPPPLHLAQSAQDMPLTSNSSLQLMYSSQGLGLREARGLPSMGQGRVGSLSSSAGTPNRISASMAGKSLTEADGLGHKKMNSLGTPQNGLLQHQQRLQQHQQLINDQRLLGYSRRPSATPFESNRADSISSSPTNAVFQRSASTDGGTTLQNNNAAPLTPISEGLSAKNSLRGQRLNGGAYAAGKSATGQGSRPLTPGLVLATTPLSAYSTLSNETARSAALSLEDVKRRTIKFIGEDGTTSIVPVSDCRDAFDVLARVLKKFGKPLAGNSYTPTAGQSTTDDDLSPINEGVGDLWGIFATSGEGQTKYLTDNELLAICHAPQTHDPLRERGLTIRRINKSDDPTKRPTGKRINKLESFFGEKVQASGSGSFLSPSSLDDNVIENNQVNTAGKKMSRANTSIILTGLGATAGNATRLNRRESKDGNRKSPPSVSSSSSMIPKKARNFFGQRPPSELISSHLTDYFPSTEKRVLERTARRSIYGRPTTSIRSKRDSSWSYAADPDAPPLPSKESIDGRHNARKSTGGPPSILIGMDSSDSNTSSHGDETAESTSRSSFTEQSPLQDWSEHTPFANGSSLPAPLNKTLVRPASIRRTSVESSKSRKSLATQLRLARGIDENSSWAGKIGGGGLGGGDRSDTASMLTVDEITQEVENRRESMFQGGGLGSTAWVVDEDGVPIPTPVSGKRKTTSSISQSTRPSSRISLNDGDSLSIVDEYLDTPNTLDRSSNVNASGEESNKRLSHSTTSLTSSRKSSILQQSEGGDENKESSMNSKGEVEEEEKEDSGEDEDEHDMSDNEEAAEEDDDDDDEDEAGGVYQSAAPGKEPIKWIKGALIGAGSFGNVFLGMNAKNGLLMAVKQVELPSSDSHNDQRKKSMLEALEREIELLKTMQHENIVQYLDSYADGTHLNIFLEYVPGGSVVALLRNYGAFEEPLVRKFVKQILHGLNYLHNRDIVHRDIKGANILVDNKSCVKISDFGISKKVESDLLVGAKSHRPSLQGSVFWMAPEVVKQTSYTRKADIWSLGCLVVEMISGTHPWANLDQMQALFKIGSHAKPQLPDDISPEAVDFLNKTFELDYTKRPLAEELLQHAFITEEFSTSPVLS